MLKLDQLEKPKMMWSVKFQHREEFNAENSLLDRVRVRVPKLVAQDPNACSRLSGPL